MGAATGTIIEAVDYNAIRNKLINVMGTGFGQSGYGQTIVSSPVAQGNQVTKAQWDNLRFDIINARIHQDGVTPTVVQAVQGQPIKYGAASPNNQYDSQANIIALNKFNVGTGQFVIDAGTSTTLNTPWTTSVSAEAIITFSSADRARWFFNSGGVLRISASRTGGSATFQNSSWSSILDTAGIQTIGGISSTRTFWDLPSTYTTIYSLSGSTPYATNNYQIQALCNVADNSVGGATIIQIRWILTDSYTDPGNSFADNPNTVDSVDGTLSFRIDEKRASGVLLPQGTGNFSIQRPNYSITSITGS